MSIRRLVLIAAVTAACHGSTETREVRSAQGGFLATFPGTPVESIKPSGVILPTDVHVFLLERGARGSMQVAYYDLAMTLDTPELRELAAKTDCPLPDGSTSFRGTGQHAVALGTVTGIATTSVAPPSATLPDGGFQENRCFLVGRRMFHIIGIGPDTANSKDEIAHFLDSFQLLAP